MIQDVSDLGFASSHLKSCRLPLRKLDLSSNSLSTLPAGSFGQLKKLEELNLAKNNLNVIDDEALTELNSLVRLHLGHNRFVALPRLALHIQHPISFIQNEVQRDRILPGHTS